MLVTEPPLRPHRCTLRPEGPPPAPPPTHRHLPALGGGGEDVGSLKDAAQAKALPGEGVPPHGVVSGQVWEKMERPA